MKRPIKTHMLDKKGDFLFKYYKCEDIDPLLDELEALREAEEFPTQQDFIDWYKVEGANMIGIYNYFKAFKTQTIEVMPEVGREYEGVTYGGDEVARGRLTSFEIHGFECKSIRPISTPTRESVLKRAKELGLTQAEIEVLGGEK